MYLRYDLDAFINISNPLVKHQRKINATKPTFMMAMPSKSILYPYIKNCFKKLNSLWFEQRFPLVHSYFFKSHFYLILADWNVPNKYFINFVLQSNDIEWLFSLLLLRKVCLLNFLFSLRLIPILILAKIQKRDLSQNFVSRLFKNQKWSSGIPW